MPDKNYIQRIHIAKKALKLTEDAYYAMLSLYGVESSKELSNAQAQHLLERFRLMGWEPGKQYNQLGARPALYATAKPLRYIEALWTGTARHPSHQSLRIFVKRITGKSDIKFISKKEASALIQAIKMMSQKNNPHEKL